MDSPRSVSLPVSVGMFAVGLLAIAAVFCLDATGHRNLPLWLNLAAMLNPLGLIVGVVAVIRQARRS